MCEDKDYLVSIKIYKAKDYIEKGEYSIAENIYFEELKKMI